PLEKGPLVLRLAEMEPVVAEDEAEVDGHVLPVRRAVPASVDAEEHVPAVPHADAFVDLLPLAAAALAEPLVLRATDEADMVRRGPVHEIGGTEDPRDAPLVMVDAGHRVLSGEVVETIPPVEPAAGFEMDSGKK